jgi:hypothetical protein
MMKRRRSKVWRQGVTLLNSVTHLAGGILQLLLGYSLGNAIDPRGLAIATFFALIFTAGHLTQEIRDHQGDAVNAAVGQICQVLDSHTGHL